jgi:hypothetical protein
MSRPTPEQKFAIGVYVGILSLVILAIWLYFIKYQFRPTKVPQEASADSLAQVVNKFQELIDEVKTQTSSAKNQLKSLVATTTKADPDLNKLLAEKTEEKLQAQRTADWKSWSNDLMSFNYPAIWEVIESKNSLTIKDKPQALTPYAIKITFSANPKNLSAADWWQKMLKDSKSPDRTTLSQDLKFGQLTALAKISDDSSATPKQYSQTILVPDAKIMVQISMATDLKENAEKKIIFEDFIKTVKFINK